MFCCEFTKLFANPLPKVDENFELIVKLSENEEQMLRMISFLHFTNCSLQSRERERQREGRMRNLGRAEAGTAAAGDEAAAN